jgi:hypothetical protein
MKRVLVAVGDARRQRHSDFRAYLEAGRRKSSSAREPIIEINGERLQDASGSRLEVCNGKVWTLGRARTWWTYESGSWIDSGSAVLPCKVP